MRLDVVGDGPLLPRLRALARGSAAPVVFHGWVGDVSALLAGADVLVSASSMEGFGRVVAEAGAWGVPAIVPVMGASAELVVGGVTGLTYDAATRTGYGRACCGRWRCPPRCWPCLDGRRARGLRRCFRSRNA